MADLSKRFPKQYLHLRVLTWFLSNWVCLPHPNISCNQLLPHGACSSYRASYNRRRAILHHACDRVGALTSNARAFAPRAKQRATHPSAGRTTGSWKHDGAEAKHKSRCALVKKPWLDLILPRHRLRKSVKRDTTQLGKIHLSSASHHRAHHWGSSSLETNTRKTTNKPSTSHNLPTCLLYTSPSPRD